MNKFLVTIIALLIIDGALSELVPAYSCIMRNTNLSWGIATILAVIMMVLNGTFKSTRYFSLALVGGAVLALSICFKVLHLTGADQTMALGHLLIFLSYSIYFIAKRPKALLDFLKFTTMLSFLIPIPLDFLNVMSEWTATVFEICGVVLLWITFLVFLIAGRKTLWARKVSAP